MSESAVVMPSCNTGAASSPANTMMNKEATVAEAMADLTIATPSSVASLETSDSATVAEDPVLVNNTKALEKKKTCFLDLPAELRNQVYDLALVNPKPNQNPIIIRQGIGVKEPTLALVSRQVRNEALPMFYGGNFFQGESYGVLHVFFDKLCSEKLGVICNISLNESTAYWFAAETYFSTMKKFEKKGLSADAVKVSIAFSTPPGGAVKRVSSAELVAEYKESEKGRIARKA